MTQSASIERYLGLDIPLKMVPALGCSRQIHARQGLSPHSHDVYEICLIEGGEVTWFVENHEVCLPAGSIFVTHPGEKHGSVRGVIEPCVLRWLQINPHRNHRWQAQLKTFPHTMQSPAGEKKLAELHEAILEECRHIQPGAEQMVASLLATFLNLLERIKHQQTTDAKLPRPVARLITMIESQPRRPWTLPELQEVSGVSRTYLLHLFKEHVGITPVAYAMRMRMREAQKLLSDPNRKITQIALLLSFSSSQHFATTFRQHYGITPSTFREQQQIM